MTPPFPSRLAVPLDTYRALVQMQIDYYATQGYAGPDWTKHAEEDIAAAFCPTPPAPASSLSLWLRRAREAQLAEATQGNAGEAWTPRAGQDIADALQREAQADKDDEAAGDWTR